MLFKYVKHNSVSMVRPWNRYQVTFSGKICMLTLQSDLIFTWTFSPSLLEKAAVVCAFPSLGSLIACQQVLSCGCGI